MSSAQADPRDATLWAQADSLLAAVEDLRRIVLTAGYHDDAAELLTVSAERAALGSLLDGRGDLVAASVADAAVCGAAGALCASARQGSVSVSLSDGSKREFAFSDRAGMSAPRWVLALSAASCAAHADALQVLLSPLAVSACQESPEAADAFWTGYCLALAALYRADGSAEDLLQAAIAGMAPAQYKHLRIADPAFVEQICAPVLQCALGIARQDATVAQAGLTAALSARAAYYGNGAGRGERQGLLAFELAGLLALARRRDMSMSCVSDQLPAALFESSGVASALTYRFPPMRLLHDGEAHWFLDLQGFPRDAREHQLLDEDGALVAIYRANGVTGLPESEARFALSDSDHTAAEKLREWPLALDAGQLYYLHDLLCRLAESGDSDSTAGIEERNRYLGETIEVRKALALRLPESAGDFDASTLHSALGRQIHEQHPELFGRNHLESIHHGLAQQGIEKAIKDLPPEAMAMAAIALLREQLTPLLHALGRDRDGSLTAQLRPRSEDYARAFLPQYAEAARTAFEAIWAEPPRVSPALPGSELKLNIAPAGMLVDDNALSWNFPGGYRSVAPLLDPHRVWVAWKLIAPGKSAGMAYDGLVWLDDHWAWFPKPYRVLAGMVPRV